MEDRKHAPWWQKGVIYQIYPRSFQDGNGDGIGDLPGIISRLDYLNDGTPRSLGVDALWISPCYPSPMVDFGYDVSDYVNIDPMFGSMDDFKLLLSEAHLRGIKVIMDLVINHTSDAHPWFVESRSSSNNPKRDWYLWHPGKNGRKPNNWFAAFELKSAWWWDEVTREFYLATFTRHQPELNWRSPKLKEAVFDVVRFWLELGVDGYRMDVANWYVKDDQWRSNPWHMSLKPPDIQRHIYDRNRPETHEVCREIRRIVDRYEDRMLVGEIYAEDPRIPAQYYGQNDELHLAFNFSFLFQKWSARAFHREIERWNMSLPEGGWPNYTLSNHDQPRHFYRYRKDPWTDARARAAAAMLLTLRGTPFIYYGEEIGMTQGEIPWKERKDPLGVKGWPFLKGRDGERSPMQWDSSAGAGFTRGKPWLPVNPDYPVKNVASQFDDPHSLLSFYRRLIWLRKETPALAVGDYRSLIERPRDFLLYRRSLGEEAVYIAINFSHKRLHLDLRQEIGKGRCRVLLGTHREREERIDTASFRLGEYEALLFV